jgi:hypothetical protein
LYVFLKFRQKRTPGVQVQFEFRHSSNQNVRRSHLKSRSDSRARILRRCAQGGNTETKSHKIFFHFQAFNKGVKEKIKIIFTLVDDVEERYQIVNTIKSILVNISSHPKEEKFRKLSKTNKKLEQRVISPPGATDLLRLVGFMEKPDCYQLPMDVAVEVLEKAVKLIEAEIDKEYGDKLPKIPTKDDLVKGKKKQDEIREKKKKDKELDDNAMKKVNEKIHQDKEKRLKK